MSGNGIKKLMPFSRIFSEKNKNETFTNTWILLLFLYTKSFAWHLCTLFCKIEHTAIVVKIYCLIAWLY